MRSFSVGAILSVLFVVAVLLWGPLSKLAIAQPGITIGFAIDGTGPIDSSEQGQDLGRFLESQLSMPIKVRSFSSEEQLYLWLTRFREVDAAWLSDSFFNKVPKGQLSPLAKPREHSPGFLSGEFVARQEMNDTLRQQMSSALMSVHESLAGRIMLAKLGASSLVPPAFWQTSEWEGLETPKNDSDRSISKDEQNLPDMGGGVELQGLAPVPPTLPKAVASTRTELSTPVDSPALASAQEALDLQPEHQEKPAPVQPVNELEALAATQAEDGSVIPSIVNTLPVVEPKKQVALVADYLAYDSVEDSYEAKGDVILSQAGVELKSEELLWQPVTQDAAASGSVQLNDAGIKMSGERLQYNMATGQGQVRDGRVFVREGNFHLVGEQIEKHGQFDYFVKEGSFTTCDGEIPDWKFSASEFDVTMGGYARAKHVWFHIRDVPVLYTPYLSFPVKTERESGFLTPAFGYSNNKGTMASLAWYQVIDRHMDATASIDYLSDAGLGKGLEYRYALPNQNKGQALYYHVTGLGKSPNPSRPEDLEDTPNFYYIKWEHRGNLPASWRLTADVEYTENKLFFEDFGESADEYSRDKTVSTVMLNRNWQKLNWVNYARFTKDLETNNDDTLQRLPEMGLHLSSYRLGDTPFYAGLDSYATRFQRDKGIDGERLYLNPSLSAVFKPGTWLEVVPGVALYERLYDTDAGNDEKFVPEFSLALATRMVKAFDLNKWGIDRIQHSIEPKVIYTYVPDEAEEDLPLFDLFDRVSDHNDIAYAVVNRIVAKSTAGDGSQVYRELFNLRLSQKYDIDEARNNRSGNDQPFSDVRVELGLQPTSNISLVADSLIPVYGNSGINTLKVGASVRDNVGNAVRVDYAYQDVNFSDLATDYVKVEIDTPILKPVYVNFQERYDFRGSRELEKVVGLEYRSKCWSIFLTYRNRYQEFEDNDQEFMFSFVLSGLGMGKGFGSGF